MPTSPTMLRDVPSAPGKRPLCLPKPMFPWDIPNGQWQEIAADYFSHSGKDYLLIADLISKYPFLFYISLKVCVPCPKTWWHHSPVRSSSILYTDQWTPIHSRIPKVPAEAVHGSHHLIPPLPSFKWVHRATGENTEDCTQHHPKMPKHPLRPS